MEIRFINSDASSNRKVSSHNTWIDRGIAVTSGDLNYRKDLEKIDPSDVVAIAVSGLGLVALGMSKSDPIIEVTDPSDIVGLSQSVEYHKQMEWVVDLRDNPISASELKGLNASLTQAVVRRVVQGKIKVAKRLAQILSNVYPRTPSHERILQTLDSISAPKPIPRFTSNRVYDRRRDIHDPFGGSSQSGISTSQTSDAIFLFTGASGKQYGYSDCDGYDPLRGNVFSYTGEGQAGDMAFKKGNKAILEHSERGYALHLFHSLGKGQGQEYIGEFVYAGHRLEKGQDKNRRQRQIIVFELVPVTIAESLENTDQTQDETDAVTQMTLADARALALAAASTSGAPGNESALQNLYKRSKAVKRYVLMRAKGTCEACRKPAPFVRSNGTPYLEPHHTTRLSDGGPDHPLYVGAICPDCHREIHHGKQGAKKNTQLEDFLREIEADI